MLAGLVRSPSQLARSCNFGGAKERQEVVLPTMVETKALTPAEAEAARGLTYGHKRPRHQLLRRYGSSRCAAGS